MNFSKKIFTTITFCFFVFFILITSCSKSTDDIVIEAPRDFAVQYATEIAIIDKYLDDYTFDYNAYLADNSKTIIFNKYDASNPKPKLRSFLEASTFPKLLFKYVPLHNVPAPGYKLYYFMISEGDNTKKAKLSNALFTSYKGFYIGNKDGATDPKEFEYNFNPVKLFLGGTIKGWQESFTNFGVGEIDTTAPIDGPLVYKNFGAGALFIPSGLAYFNQPPSASIPTYAPLVFGIKLYAQEDTDLEGGGVGDGIFTSDEVNADGSLTKDTDGDGQYDFLDNDDDNDGFTTKAEIKKLDGTFYNFIDIPVCPSTNIKRHLSNACHN